MCVESQRKTAKRLIKVAKSNPTLYTREDVLYAKLIKKANKNQKMKIFLDTAVFEDIYKFNQTGLIDGVTTNPSLILKSGGDPVETIKKNISEFPFFESISAEVVADDALKW